MCLAWGLHSVSLLISLRSKNMSASHVGDIPESTRCIYKCMNAHSCIHYTNSSKCMDKFWKDAHKPLIVSTCGNVFLKVCVLGKNNIMFTINYKSSLIGK